MGILPDNDGPSTEAAGPIAIQKKVIIDDLRAAATRTPNGAVGSILTELLTNVADELESSMHDIGPGVITPADEHAHRLAQTIIATTTARTRP